MKSIYQLKCVIMYHSIQIQPFKESLNDIVNIDTTIPRLCGILKNDFWQNLIFTVIHARIILGHNFYSSFKFFCAQIQTVFLIYVIETSEIIITPGPRHTDKLHQRSAEVKDNYSIHLLQFQIPNSTL